MRTLVFILFAFVAKVSFGQTDQLKANLSQNWVIKQYEQFGVIDEPTEEQVNDKIKFRSDNTCSITENGVNYSGTWTIDKTRKYILCTLKNKTINRNYKIISVDTNKAIIEYQTPDLIRTQYHMVVE